MAGIDGFSTPKGNQDQQLKSVNETSLSKKLIISKNMGLDAENNKPSETDTKMNTSKGGKLLDKSNKGGDNNSAA